VFDELYYYPEHMMSHVLNKTLLLPDY